MSDESLGECLRRKREAMDLTQEELADRADVPQSVISRAETDQSTPSISNLTRIANALGTTADELLRNRTGRPTDRDLRVGVHSSLFAAVVLLAQLGSSRGPKLAMSHSAGTPIWDRSQPPSSDEPCYDGDTLLEHLHEGSLDCIVTPRLAAAEANGNTLRCATVTFAHALCDVTLVNARAEATPRAAVQDPVLYVATREVRPFLAQLPQTASNPAAREWVRSPLDLLSRARDLTAAAKAFTMISWEPWTTKVLEALVHEDSSLPWSTLASPLGSVRATYDVIATRATYHQSHHALVRLLLIIRQSLEFANQYLCGRSYTEILEGRGAALLHRFASRYHLSEQSAGAFCTSFAERVEWYLAPAWLDHIAKATP